MTYQQKQNRSGAIKHLEILKKRTHTFSFRIPMMILLTTTGLRWTGCTPAGMDVVTLARRVGIDKPYVGAMFFSTDSETLCSALLNSLANRGAKITACDTSIGLIAWCDTGAGFNVMPNKIKRKPYQLGHDLTPPIAEWQGIVFAAARLRADNKGSWLFLHAVSRDINAATVFESDGTYERSLFKDVSSALSHNVATSERCATLVERYNLASKQSVGPKLPAAATDYTGLYYTHFNQFVPPKISDVRRVGQSRLYPVSLSDSWSACIDVAWQYDTIVEVSPLQSRLVFAHGMSIPTDNAKSKDKFQYIDVLMVVYAEERGSGGTNVFIAYVAPGTFQAKPITELTNREPEDIKQVLKEAPRETMALLVADQFFSQVSTQLLYKERWKDKFSRRRVPQNSGAPHTKH